MAITLMPPVWFTEPDSLLTLLGRTRRLTRSFTAVMAECDRPVVAADSMKALLDDCRELLCSARHAAAMTQDDAHANFYIELVTLFRGANRSALEELGLRLRGAGQWEVDDARVEAQLLAYPRVSRLFLKQFLQQGLEPLTNRWACHVELH